MNAMISLPKIHCVQQANAILGEGPSWDPRKQALYWIDIRRPAVFRFEAGLGQTGHWPLPLPVGCVAPVHPENRLVFADANGFGFLELETGAIARIADPESHLPGNRFNDGKVDRAGRLWAGTIDDRCIEPVGSLYRLDRDGMVSRMATGFICSNGLGWSPDNRTMYFTDSMVRTIWAYEFDLASGELGERRVFAKLPRDDGVPDGLTVDREGFVWSAIWDGWRVIRYAPDGSVDKEVRMPVQRPSSCMFGGPDLTTLYITSACVELDRNALKSGPLAGALFTLECDVGGLAEMPFEA
jgi:sugar lactone lactonase YvrE